MTIGPERVDSFTKSWITNQTNSGFYSILNIQVSEHHFQDIWILSKNLTKEEQDKLEALSKSPDTLKRNLSFSFLDDNKYVAYRIVSYKSMINGQENEGIYNVMDAVGT